MTSAGAKFVGCESKNAALINRKEADNAKEIYGCRTRPRSDSTSPLPYLPFVPAMAGLAWGESSDGMPHFFRSAPESVGLHPSRGY